MAAKKSKFKNSSKLQQIILGIGILVLLVAFILYGLEVFYKEPQWNDYCKEDIMPRPVYSKFGNMMDTKENCETQQGKWTDQQRVCTKEELECPNCPGGKLDCPQGYCNYYFYCQKDYDKASEKHSMYVLFVLSTLGVAIIIGGLFVTVPVISNSIMAGGVIIIIRGVVGAWNFLSKYLQWALLGVLLALLLWVAYKKFGQR